VGSTPGPDGRAGAFGVAGAEGRFINEGAEAARFDQGLIHGFIKVKV
jgi:hypothetical protein